MKVFLLSLLLCLKLALVFSGCPTIISKNRWGGRPSQEVDYIPAPVNYVIIHHTDTPTCLDEDACSRRLANIQSYHMDTNGWHDIGYNFMIGGDGQIYEGVGWRKTGAHTKGWNSKSIGIAFVGNFESKAPSSKQLEAGKKLIECGVSLGELSDRYKLLGARSVRDTDSPGLALFREIQNWRGFTRRA